MALAIIGYEYNFALPPGDHINRPSDLYCNSLIEGSKKAAPHATKSGGPAPQIQPPLEDVL
jgi:hypothetical protein